MPDLQYLKDSYRRYALHEKGHRMKTVDQTLTIFTKLHCFSQAHRIEDLTTHNVREFLYYKKEQRNWSPKTFRLYRQYLKSFFGWIVREQIIKSNPVTPIEQPPLPQALPRCLSKEKALSVMNHVHWHRWKYTLEKSRNEAIFATFLYTGLRLSELRDLRCREVNLKEKELLVFEGKNNKSRIIPIHPKLHQILTIYVRERKRLAAPSLWFFPSVKSEKRLTHKNIQSIFKKVSIVSGTKVTPHMLRHTFGRLCVESKLNLRVTQRIMGHSDIRTTQIYTYVSSQAMKDSIGQINIL